MTTVPARHAAAIQPLDAATLMERAQDGDRRALARALSYIEEGGEVAIELGRLAWKDGGTAHTVGITGAPGAGKSTLTAALVGQIRSEAQDKVAVLAVDPSSPMSGGAILGDRIRMHEHALDGGVFIRSMATRGHLGGLALATDQAIRVLDAMRVPWIIIETVGVGQVELEIADTADTTVVVVTPAWGDSVQTNKAGLLEIADVFVINKADRDGVESTRRDLEAMLDLAPHDPDGWRPPVITTVANTGQGADELRTAITAHRDVTSTSGTRQARRHNRIGTELQSILLHSMQVRTARLARGELFGRLRDEVSARRLDPYNAATIILDGDGQDSDATSR